MNVTKCVNGHFFDAEKYEHCPHCGAVSVQSPQAASVKKAETPMQQPMPDMVEMPQYTVGKTVGVFGNDVPFDEEPAPVEETPVSVEPMPDKVCVNCQTANRSTANFCLRCGTPLNAPVAEPPMMPIVEFVPNVKAEEPVEVVSTEKTEEINVPEPTLEEQLQQVTVSAGDKTVGFFSVGNVQVASEPVVGWLVCVKGAHFGESFAIVSGRNAVGRDASNAIVLERDATVSRSKHAWIIFEPKKRDFFVQTGESSGLSYLNGETVMEPKSLAARDVLEFGGGKYLFVPLCDESFSWETYLN